MRPDKRAKLEHSQELELSWSSSPSSSVLFALDTSLLQDHSEGSPLIKYRFIEPTSVIFSSATHLNMIVIAIIIIIMMMMIVIMIIRFFV